MMSMRITKRVQIPHILRHSPNKKLEHLLKIIKMLMMGEIYFQVKPHSVDLALFNKESVLVKGVKILVIFQMLLVIIVNQIISQIQYFNKRLQ